MWRQCIFFFSSRRRHTRYWRDWSSDVCSSDLSDPAPQFPQPHLGPIEQQGEGQEFPVQHPQSYDDDDVTGTLRGQERKTRDDKGEPANEVSLKSCQRSSPFWSSRSHPYHSLLDPEAR